MVDPSLLDAAALAEVEPDVFHRAAPYPWLALRGAISDAAFESLRRSLPPLSLMTPSFGRKRAHGQQPHDRYALVYRPDLPLDPVWHRLVEELHGRVYQDWLARLFETRRFRIGCHWHYTPRGCSVSPHCDARRKLGSHIFYFNTEDDWDPAWGGQTLILDDEGRFRRNSAPLFEDFPRRHTAPSIGNRSLLFRRQGNSWHGVEPVTCPDDRMRKVFIVVIDADGAAGRVRRVLHRWWSRRRPSSRASATGAAYA